MVPCCGSIVLGELEALTNALASDEPGSAQAALRLAKQFNDNLVLVYDTDIASQTKPKVISKLLEVCKALEALNTRLLRPRTATGGGQPPALLNEPSLALMTRLDAALIAIDAFGGIAAFLDVSKKDAARIARPALQLVFGACHAALVAATAGRQSAQGSELAGWLSGSFPAYASHCLEAGSSLVLKQFKTSEEGLVFGPTVAPADVLVPWLASVAGALLVCYPRPADHLPFVTVQYYVDMASVVVDTPQFERHAAVMEAQPLLQQDRVLAMLLLRCLPSLVAALEELCGDSGPAPVGGAEGAALSAILADDPDTLPRLACRLCLAATSPSLTRALCGLAGVPVGAVAVRQALRLFKVLRRLPTTGVDPRLRFDALRLSMNVVGCLSGLRVSPQMAGLAHPGGAASRSRHWDATAYDVMSLVPLIPSALEGLPPSIRLQSVAAFCGSCGAAILLVERSHPRPSLQQLSEVWAPAADAALCLLPRLFDLYKSLQQPALLHQGHWKSIMLLTGMLVLHMWHNMGGRAAEEIMKLAEGQLSVSAAQEPVAVRLAEQLWGLHNRSAQLVHWLLAEQERGEIMAHVFPDNGWVGFLGGFNYYGTAVLHAIDYKESKQGPCSGDGDTFRRPAYLQIAAAKKEVLRAIAGRPDILASTGGAVANVVAEGMVWVMKASWRLADAGLFAGLKAALNLCRADGNEAYNSLSHILVQLLNASREHHCLVIGLTQAGVLAKLLSAVDALAAAGSRREANILRGIPGGPAGSANDMMGMLARAAEHAHHHMLLPGNGAGPSTDADAASAALAEQLGEAKRQLAIAMETRPVFGAFTDLRLQPALTAADLAQKCWRRTEEAAAARLEVAQAVCTRSCAFLACSNMAATGGPAASQGSGSKRCAGCRVAWYCGTACSHADWRAGHGRVCKALAAAKQQQAVA